MRPLRYFRGHGPGGRVLRLPRAIAHRRGWGARCTLSGGIGFGAPQLRRRVFGNAQSNEPRLSRDRAVEKYLSVGTVKEAANASAGVDLRGGGCGAVVIRQVRRINGILLTVTIRRSRDCADFTGDARAVSLQIEVFDHSACAIHAIVCSGIVDASRNAPPPAQNGDNSSHRANFRHFTYG